MHYTILVSNTNKKSLKKQMLPFCEEPTKDNENTEREYFCYVKDYQKYIDEKIIPEIEDLRVDFENDKSVKSWTTRELRKFKESNKPLDKLIMDYTGGLEDENGNLYYLYNPKAKWDWFSVGGRSDGWLIAHNKCCNRAKKKDIDREAMKKADTEIARLQYRKYIGTDHEDILKWGGYDISSEDNYIKSLDLKAQPYGYLHNGDWVDREDWQEQFNDLFEKWWEKLPDDTEITVVDCHI